MLERVAEALDERGGVQSVELAGGLLRLLVEAGEPLRLADLSRRAGVPSAKAHRYLVSLGRAGLVEQDPGTTRYGLGPLLRRAGIAALTQSDALLRAERMLKQIVAKTGETAAVAVWGTHGPTHVRLEEARHEWAATVAPGHVCPMTYSASGLVFCAFGDPRIVLQVAEREMAQSRATDRPGAPRDTAELQQAMALVRDDGFATVSSEGGTGLAAVSVPVFETDRERMRFALTVFAPAGRLNVSADGPIVKLMRDAANALGAELHGAGRAGVPSDDPG